MQYTKIQEIVHNHINFKLSWENQTFTEHFFSPTIPNSSNSILNSLMLKPQCKSGSIKLSSQTLEIQDKNHRISSGSSAKSLSLFPLLIWLLFFIYFIELSYLYFRIVVSFWRRKSLNLSIICSYRRELHFQEAIGQTLI